MLAGLGGRGRRIFSRGFGLSHFRPDGPFNVSLSRWAKTSASHKNFGSPGKFQSTNMECVQNTDGCRIGVLISAPQPGTRR